jgi:mannose-6-phosphate isomerase-like protein (cupin superfamily)
MTQPVQIVKYAELVPCRTAFIDAHTPGSDQKENFTIIGGGVSEAADQHIHIKDTPGFNIGAAGQPPKCRNSLHTHRTAEVFFVLSGRWRFFWGRWGDTGEVILEPGDIFNIPTAMFRGFENIGSDYGMIMAILGGDDAGGGVIWAPQVIEEAHKHGLILGENGRLYDSKQGKALPKDVAPMPVLSDAHLSLLAEPSVAEVVPRWVARYLDLLALSGDKPVEVIGEHGLIFDRPGFSVDFISAPSTKTVEAQPYYTVLMPVKGYWRLHHNGHDSHIGPGDTAFLQPDNAYELTPAMSGEAALYRINNTNDTAGPSWWERS